MRNSRFRTPTLFGRIDAENLAAWIAVGIVALRETQKGPARRVRKEVRRVGLGWFFDVLAFAAYYRLRVPKSDAAWIAQQMARLWREYPADLRSNTGLCPPSRRRDHGSRKADLDENGPPAHCTPAYMMSGC